MSLLSFDRTLHTTSSAAVQASTPASNSASTFNLSNKRCRSHSTPFDLPTRHLQIHSQPRVDRTIESNARTSGSEERKEASRLGKEDQEGTSYRYTSIPVELVDFSQTRHTHIPSTIERSYLYSRSSFSGRKGIRLWHCHQLSPQHDDNHNCS